MICDVCKEQPAVYGDGTTWGRCAKCQLEATKNDPVPQEPTLEGDGVPHQRIKGLTSIIIPVYMLNYSLFHMTGNCIGSVREHTEKQKDPYEIIIVDNGSPVQPPNINSYYAEKIIKWEENKGVTKAWNAGIRASFGDYVVLLNNDVQVYDGWLSTMKKCLDQGELDLVMAKPMYSLTEPFARATEAYREQGRWEGKDVKESFENFKDFSCVMFKKDLVDEIGIEGQGLFDEIFFNYASDSDLFKRMDELGLKYATCKAVPIHHIIDATGNAIEQTPDIMNEDKKKFEEKWAARVMQPASEDVGQASSEADSVTPDQPQAPLVRVEAGGDAVYLVRDDHVYWITTLEVLQSLGYQLGQEKVISKEEFTNYIRGENINSFNVEKFKNAQI